MGRCVLENIVRNKRIREVAKREVAKREVEKKEVEKKGGKIEPGDCILLIVRNKGMRKRKCGACVCVCVFLIWILVVAIGENIKKKQNKEV